MDDKKLLHEIITQLKMTKPIFNEKGDFKFTINHRDRKIYITPLNPKELTPWTNVSIPNICWQTAVDKQYTFSVVDVGQSRWMLRTQARIRKAQISLSFPRHLRP
jgi:hypothetical protein